MAQALTYFQFHVAFLVPAVALLAAVAAVSRSRAPGTTAWPVGRSASFWPGVVAVTAIAVVYTTPWDSYLIARGVWSYGEGRVLFRVVGVPVEEMLFFLVQPVLTALWLAQLQLPDRWAEPDRPRLVPRLAAGLVAVAIGAIGWQLLASDATFYLGAILAWGAPVLTLQWVVGAPQLWDRRRTVALGVLVPTVYLCVADRIAIGLGIWTISEQYSTGLAIAGLPVEEAVFFLLTNCFVVQGLVLYRWVVDVWG